MARSFLLLGPRRWWCRVGGHDFGPFRTEAEAQDVHEIEMIRAEKRRSEAMLDVDIAFERRGGRVRAVRQPDDGGPALAFGPWRETERAALEALRDAEHGRPVKASDVSPGGAGTAGAARGIRAKGRPEALKREAPSR